MIAALPADDVAVVVAIVAARLLVPLLIPRYPLLILVALVLDAVDNGLLARATAVDLGPDGPYQSWDKALDIYYLSIAYLATLRNWTSGTALRIARFLFYYRLVGIVLFELLDARAMLLLFPNVFEYFFIAYEGIRLRYEPARLSPRVWLVTAGVLWVGVKLPQEYWIHIAQRDVTDTLSENPAAGVAVAVAALALLLVLGLVVRPRLPAPDGSGRLAADELPGPLDAAREHHARHLRDRRAFATELAEKVALLALLCTIFAEILPSVGATPPQVAVGVLAIVGANAALSVSTALAGRIGRRSAAARFGGLAAANLVLVFVAHRLLTADDDFQLGAGLFFAFLITLIVWLFDAFKPVADERHGGARAPREPVAGAPA